MEVEQVNLVSMDAAPRRPCCANRKTSVLDDALGQQGSIDAVDAAGQQEQGDQFLPQGREEFAVVSLGNVVRKVSGVGHRVHLVRP